MFDPLDVSEQTHRFVAGRGRMHPARDQIIDAFLHVERDLIVHVGAQFRAPEPQIATPLRRHAGAGVSAEVSTRPTASAKSVQVVTLSARVRRPSGVSR